MSNDPDYEATQKERRDKNRAAWKAAAEAPTPTPPDDEAMTLAKFQWSHLNRSLSWSEANLAQQAGFINWARNALAALRRPAPPAPAADGVTEEMIEAAAIVLYRRRHGSGWARFPESCRVPFRRSAEAAITAALAARSADHGR